MSTVKFRKVPELFPNRKVRTVRTEQLCVKLTLMLPGHNLAKTGTSPLNGPIVWQNKAYQVIFCTLKKLLPVLYFYFQFCDPTLQLTENDLLSQ